MFLIFIYVLRRLWLTLNFTNKKFAEPYSPTHSQTQKSKAISNFTNPKPISFSLTPLPHSRYTGIAPHRRVHVVMPLYSQTSPFLTSLTNPNSFLLPLLTHIAMPHRRGVPSRRHGGVPASTTLLRCSHHHWRAFIPKPFIPNAHS